MRGEREPELQAHVGAVAGSSGGSASARRRNVAALSGAPRAIARSAAARRSVDRLGSGRGLGAQQVQGDALGVGALGGEHGGRPGVPLRELARRRGSRAGRRPRADG